MNTYTHDLIKKIDNVFSIGDLEKRDDAMRYSPKKGITFVKIYNPYTSNGIYLHSNKRTKYIHFNCRLYNAPKLIKTFENFKTHILEMPVATCFQTYKKALSRNKIRQDISIYIIIYKKGKYDYFIKIIKNDSFFVFLELNQQKEKEFRLMMENKSEYEHIGEIGT